MTKLIVTLWCVYAAAVAQADIKEFFHQRYLQKTAPSFADDLDKVTTGTYTQLLNHRDAIDARTFSQRYFISTAYALTADAPVLFYLCGEGSCDPRSLDGAIKVHAQSLKANIVALEHRYYGTSMPFDKLTTENLRYLSTEQALADAAGFQKFLTDKMKLTGKWIAIGGSYAGSLAAFYRMKYPNLVVGALSSSGPVQAHENFEAYDHHVNDVAGPKCAAKMRQVVAEAEAALNNPDDLAALKMKFQAEVLTDPDDLLYVIADVGAIAIQYGFRDTFCAQIDVEHPLEGYAEFARYIFELWQLTPLQDSVQGAMTLDAKDYQDGVGFRQWYYQSCTEYGYWQNAFHDAAGSVRSSRINPAYYQRLCQRLFGLDQPVDISKTNAQFYQPLLSPTTSQILFTNGSQDPWSLLGISEANGNATNPNTTTFRIEGAAHSDDLRPALVGDSAVLKEARALFRALATEWLK
jgi:pimeloyl-ACP methyl ester carboxylesterase